MMLFVFTLILYYTDYD